jgi:hypothetical protein
LKKVESIEIGWFAKYEWIINKYYEVDRENV